MDKEDFIKHKMHILSKEGKYTHPQQVAIAFSMWNKEQNNAQQGTQFQAPSAYQTFDPNLNLKKLDYDNLTAPYAPTNYAQNFANQNPLSFQQTIPANIGYNPQNIQDNYRQYLAPEAGSGTTQTTPQYNDVTRYNLINNYGGIDLEGALSYAGQGFGSGNAWQAGTGTALSALKGARNFLTGYASGKENKRVVNEQYDALYNPTINYQYQQQGGEHYYNDYYQEGGQKDNELTNAQMLTNKYITDQPLGNTTVEGGEFIKKAQTGNVKQVVGDAHIENGKVGDGVNVMLQNGDKVLSDYTKIPAKDVKELKQRYDLSLKKGATFADAQKAFDKKLGIQKTTDELSKYIEDFGKNDSVQDETSKRLNETVLSKKIEQTKSKLTALGEPQSMIFEDLFNIQESLPKKGDGSQLYDKNGKEVKSENNVAQQGLKKADPALLAPVNYIDSYLKSAEFKKRFKGIPQDYKEAQILAQKARNNYNPYVLEKEVKGDELGSRVSFGEMNQIYGLPKGTNIVLSRPQAKELGADLFNDILPHEYSHTARDLNFSDELNFAFSNKDPKTQDKFIKWQEAQSNGKTKEDFSTWLKKSKGNEHDNAPDENYSDLNSLRYLMNKAGIYDTRKGNMTKEHLEKAKKDSSINNQFNFKRLRKKFKDDDIIKLNNTVAFSDEDDDNTYAQQGGSYSVTKTTTPQQVSAMNVKKDFGGWEVTPEFGTSGYFTTEEEFNRQAKANQALQNKTYDPNQGFSDITMVNTMPGADGSSKVGTFYKVWKNNASSYIGKPIPETDIKYYNSAQYKEFQNSPAYQKKYGIPTNTSDGVTEMQQGGNYYQSGGELADLAGKYGLSLERVQELLNMQQGGIQNQQPIQEEGGDMFQQISQALQQGVDPNQIAKKLMNQGATKEQAQELIGQILQHLQGQSQKMGQQGGVQTQQEEQVEGNTSNPQEEQGEVSPEQVMQQVAQALQQGADPNQVLQQLIQMGVPQEQAQQLIGQVMQQLQGQQNQQATPEEQAIDQEMPVAQQGVKYNFPNILNNYEATPDFQPQAGYSFATRYTPTIAGYDVAANSIVDQSTLENVEPTQSYTGEGYGKQMQNVDDTIKLHSWYFNTDAKKKAFKEAVKKKGEQKEVLDFQKEYNKEVAKRGEKAGLTKDQVLELVNKVGFSNEGVQKLDGLFGAFTSTRPLFDFKKSPENKNEVTVETTTPEGDKVAQTTETRNVTKNVTPWLPENLRLAPSALNPLSKEQIALGRQEPVKLTVEPYLANQASQQQTAQAQIQASGLSPQQQLALSSQGLASSQMAANDAIAKTEQFNAQSQQSADQFNIGQRAKEEITNANYNQVYQGQMLQGLANQERDWRRFYNEGNAQNRANYKDIENINMLNAQQSQYNYVPGQGVIFLNNQATPLPVSTGISKEDWDKLTAEQQFAFTKAQTAKMNQPAQKYVDYKNKNSLS